MKNSEKIFSVIFTAVLLAGLFGIPAASADQLNLLEGDNAEIVQTVQKRLKKKLKDGTYFILGIEGRIKNTQGELSILKDNEQQLRARIRESKTRVRDLQSQLENLGALISSNAEKMNAVKLQIARYENSIANLNEDKRRMEKILNERLRSLNSVVNSYYLQTNAFFSEQDNPKLLAFLAADETSGEILQQQGYLLYLRDAGEELGATILKTQNELDQKQTQIEAQQSAVSDLREMLLREQKDLLETQASKRRLIDETQGKQAIYETLLELSKKEIEQVGVQIERLKENYAFFEEKLKTLGKLPDARLDFDAATALSGAMTALAWPVSPALGLTAFFQDSEYKKALGVEHNAVDIRLSQGSRVRAAADGVVSKVADNGFAYSYIIISHPENILTLYGHMTEILVKEGEIVRQGGVIGLSGGIPGTKGAGWLTTGAHLHFEVFKDWKQVDPLPYLPLEYLSLQDIPEKYLQNLEITGSSSALRQKVKRL